MAQLKSSIVQGSLRVTDTTYTNDLVVNGSKTAKYVLAAPNAAAGAPTWRILSNSDVGLGNVTNDAQIAKSIGTTKGDMIYFTGNAAPARLAIGTAGYTLQATANGPAWTQIVEKANGGTGNTTGTATYATTTADTTNSLYPVGVSSSATTTLCRNTAIQMTGASLTLNPTASGATVSFTNNNNLMGIQATGYWGEGGVATSTNTTQWMLVCDNSGNTRVQSISGAICVDGDLHVTTGWIRSYNGYGWYCQSYGGGFYMSDDTWLRSYDNKKIYDENGFWCGNGFQGFYNNHASWAYWDIHAGPSNLDFKYHSSNTGTSTTYTTVAHIVGSTGQYIQDSSRTKKHNILPLQPMGDIIDKLQPISFIYNKDKTNTLQYGLIFEDTINIIPAICNGNLANLDEAGISYSSLVPVLLKEIQELRKRVKALEGGI